MLPVAFLGYLINGAWNEGMDIIEFYNAFEMVCNNPFANYFEGVATVKAVIVAESVYAMALIMYYTSLRNYMPGKEYGTAKFADIGMVNKVIRDKDEGRNRILSKNVKMSLNTRQTKLNNNILIIGGSGAGKTFYEVKPNLMQLPKNCSFVITDPKAEILRSCGGMLKKNGYRIKVINLIDMEQSDCYNPFSYIRNETDVIKLITNLIANTTPKGTTPNDPFWEKAEGMFLQALFYYVWLEEPPSRRNFKRVLELMAEAEVPGKDKKSKLTQKMEELAGTSTLGKNHPAYKQYMKVMGGAGDTVRTIIISANSRLAFLENNKVLQMLSRDDLKLEELGIGVNGDEKTRTALFCVIPDSDKSYNFIIGMLYTQIFQELYYQADFNYGGKLPVHVTFMLDEFANVALPDDYCSLLSTMRSREISSVIIIQNLAQIKALFQDTWETIPGNCDTLIYLGGNEQSTHKYISELLGKGTIDKKATGETRGRQGSSSRNYDVLGRELMTPDEARKFDNRKCLIFIRGFDPIVDDKYVPFNHPVFCQTSDGGGEAYIHKPWVLIKNPEEKKKEESKIYPACEMLSENSVKYYEKLKEKGEKIYITDMKFDTLMILNDVGLTKRFIKEDEEEQKRKALEELGIYIEYDEEATDSELSGEKLNNQDQKAENSDIKNSSAKKRKKLCNDSLTTRMTEWDFSNEQKDEALKALKSGIPKEEILNYFYPEVSVEEMIKRREAYSASTV